MRADADKDFAARPRPGHALRRVWLRQRNRLLASPRFQRWAAAFPLTRPIARHQSKALFDLCAGFVYAQVLFACVRLGLFEALADGEMSTSQLAARLNVPPANLRRLLRAAQALDLVEPRPDDAHALGPKGAVLSGNVGIRAMIEHHAAFYADLADPVALLRDEASGTALSTFWPYAGGTAPRDLSAARVQDYSALMAASQPMIAAEVVAAYPFHRHHRLLDVGGGEAVFLEAVARRTPDLELCLFDLPAVAERARAHLERAGLGPRAEAIGGDMFADPLPRDADVVTLVRVLHDHDDDSALAILRAVRKALAPGGRVVIAEPMAGARSAETVGDAYFAFYLLAMGRGRPRSPDENKALLRTAGFADPRDHTTRQPLLTRVISAGQQNL